MTAIVVAETLALCLLAFLIFGLLRSHAEILRALHHVGIDYFGERDQTTPSPRSAPAGNTRPATDLEGETPRGDAIAIGLTNAGAEALLLFLSSGCDKCERFWSAMAAGAHQHLGLRVIAVTRAADQESPDALMTKAAAGIDVVLSTSAWDAYGVPGSPYAIYCQGGQVVGEGSAQTWEQLSSLLSQARADARSRRPPEGAGEGSAPAHAALHASPTSSSDRAARIAAARRAAERTRQTMAARETRYDDALLAAGITPHDPRLYHPNGSDSDASMEPN